MEEPETFANFEPSIPDVSVPEQQESPLNGFFQRFWQRQSNQCANRAPQTQANLRPEPESSTASTIEADISESYIKKVVLKLNGKTIQSLSEEEATRDLSSCSYVAFAKAAGCFGKFEIS